MVNEVPVSPDLLGQWDNVLSDMEDTEDAYVEEGWETKSLHPGDVSVLPQSSDRSGLDVLVPDNEFEEFQALVDGMDSAFDEFSVFRQKHDEVIYGLIVAEGKSEEIAVLLPVYYQESDARPLIDEVKLNSQLHVHVHPLSRSKGEVTFEMDEPEKLFPE